MNFKNSIWRLICSNILSYDMSIGDWTASFSETPLSPLKLKHKTIQRKKKHREKKRKKKLNVKRSKEAENMLYNICIRM